jgi:hypothetical protein
MRDCFFASFLTAQIGFVPHNSVCTRLMTSLIMLFEQVFQILALRHKNSHVIYATNTKAKLLSVATYPSIKAKTLAHMYNNNNFIPLCTHVHVFSNNKANPR